MRDVLFCKSRAIKGCISDFATVVRAEEAFYQCGKAITRSKLWATQKAALVDGLPTYAEALHPQIHFGLSFDDIGARLKQNDQNRLYDA